jgi:hypothetical protein
MSRNRKATAARIVLSGFVGLCLVALAALALTQLLSGSFPIKLHSSERYGLFVTAPAFTALIVFGIGGSALIWRAVILWRERFNGKP